jgi:hypothetical protein
MLTSVHFAPWEVAPASTRNCAGKTRKPRPWAWTPVSCPWGTRSGNCWAFRARSTTTPPVAHGNSAGSGRPGAFTLTIPATSTTYAGMTWQMSSQGYVITYSGTFKYITATRNSWTVISASTYASPATALWHTLYCDGTSWLIDIA